MNQISRSFLAYRLHIIIRDIIIHLALALIVGIIIYLRSARLSYVIILILGGILVDIDHLFDYFLAYKKNKFNLKKFFIGGYLSSGKVYLFLHSWEIDVFILLLALAVNSRGLLIFSLGLTIHFLVDNLQRENLLFYLLTYRAIKNFEVKILLPELLPFQGRIHTS